ncbi:MAG: ABC transporter permease [Acidobacteria bacterium]|nr:ABC transporter permease [Acidobacteriota bacterium]
MFGVAWGVGSLLLLVGLGEGFRLGQHEQLSTLGQDVLFMFGGNIPAVPGQHTDRRPYKLTYADYVAAQSEAPHVRAITPVISRGDLQSASDHATSNGQVLGVEPNFGTIRSIPIASGRWISEADVTEARHVAVVGIEMRKNLFQGEAPVGNHILLNGIRFEVVGLADNVGGRREDNPRNAAIYIPFTTMREHFPVKDADTRDAISYMNYQPRSREDHELAKEEVRRVVARQHGFDPSNHEAFEDWDTVKSEEMVGKIFDGMDYFLGGVGIVTLALGAIGIINIMLVAVAERTREIGLRKALGATRRNILTQFLLEGVVLTGFSGGVGVVAAGGLMAVLAKLPQPPGFDTPRLVPVSAFIAVASLALAGIAAGVYPARKAAMLEPVEALRQE